MVTYKEFQPPDPLDQFIKCFWVLEKEYTCETPVENVLPDSYIEFILNFGSPYYIKNEGDLPRAFMIGLLKKPLPLRANGTVIIVCARFFPWGLNPFFEMQVQQNVNTNFDFDEAITKKIGGLLDGAKYDEAVMQLQSCFTEKYIRSGFDKKTVNAAARILYEEKGECRIDDLARMCFTTQRTLQRNFNSEFGVSPKSYASNVRFDKAKKTLTHNPFSDLTQLAHDSGYYDQAHFIKEFKAFCGCTPSEFAESIKRMSSIFADSKNVVFLQ